MIGNFAIAVGSLLIGWACLFPARRALGAALTHLAALPVGVIGWSMVAALCTIARVPPYPGWVAAGLALYIGVVAGISAIFGRSGNATVTWRSYASFGAAYALLTGAFVLGRATMLSFDSYAHYELSAWYLFNTGNLSAVIMGMRGPLIPALHMGNRVWAAIRYTPSTPCSR